MAEHLTAQSQALLVGPGMNKTQAVVSHQPPLHRSVAPIQSVPFLMTVPMESQAIPPLQRAGTPEHCQLCSACFHPQKSAFQPPTSSLFGHGASLCEETEQGSPETTVKMSTGLKGGSGRAGSELPMDHWLPSAQLAPGSPFLKLEHL